MSFVVMIVVNTLLSLVGIRLPKLKATNGQKIFLTSHTECKIFIQRLIYPRLIKLNWHS